MQDKRECRRERGKSWESVNKRRFLFTTRSRESWVPHLPLKKGVVDKRRSAPLILSRQRGLRVAAALTCTGRSPTTCH